MLLVDERAHGRVKGEYIGSGCKTGWMTGGSIDAGSGAARTAEGHGTVWWNQWECNGSYDSRAGSPGLCVKGSL